MCGIAGIVRRSPLQPADLERLRAMRAALRHRGPDGEGELVTPHVALGMRRLSIIDLAGGGQPLHNEDQSVSLVANGEIYNFVELRRDLEARGHRFRTGSDCEPIVHLYEEHGVDFVRHLRGMFAVALWDARWQRLVLARDRLGEKPLYLHQVGDGLMFASELKALVRGGVAAGELEPAVVHQFFCHQFVPEPATPLPGVRKLDAAHRLIVDVPAWTTHEECYWRLADAPEVDGEPGPVIRQELEQVAGLVVRSDVPVGVALSGGLDSSAIAALAAARYPGTLAAFSVGYAGRPPGDERAAAAAFARHLGLPFHEVELRTPDLVACFPRLVAWQDDPVADISGFGYHAVMQAARAAGVPVMLQGQGGDELFWGYDWVREAARATARLRDRQRMGLAAGGQYLTLAGPGWWGPRTLARWLGGACGLRRGWREWQRDGRKGADDSLFYELDPAFAGALARADQWESGALGAAGRQTRPEQVWTHAGDGQLAPAVLLTRQICDSYLRANGLAQGDRLSMASGVELRLPLVDYRLVETVIGLRKRQPDVGLPPKAWLRAALAGLVPDWVLNRPKRGFTPPVAEWVQALRQAHGPALRDGRLVKEGWLQRAAVDRWAGAGPVGDDDLWFGFKALVLEHWWQALRAGEAPGQP